MEQSPLIRADTLTFGRKMARPHFVLNCCASLCNSKIFQGQQPCSQQHKATSLENHKYCKKHCQRAFIFHKFPQLIGLSPPSLLSQLSMMTFRNSRGKAAHFTQDAPLYSSNYPHSKTSYTSAKNSFFCSLREIMDSKELVQLGY